MSNRNEEVRRQLGFGQNKPYDMRDMAFSVKVKEPDKKAEPTVVPADSYFCFADIGDA